MDDHVDLKVLSAVIGWIILAVSGGIAWGRLNERVKKHDKAVEGCHMDDYQTEEECRKQIENCAGASKAAETYTRVVRIESDIKEIKDDMKKSDDKFHESQVQLGSTIARIETQIQAVLDKRGNNE